MQVEDTYFSISAPGEGLYKESGSRFIALSYPVETPAQVKEIVDTLRNRYHDARHVCYAYRLGQEGELWRANDDGEPSGSAGRPILGQIDSAGLSDVLVVVVRYFGGVKLGIPGLVNAYRTSCAEALSCVPRVQKITASSHIIEFPTGIYPSVMKMIKELSLGVESQEFAQTCRMELRVRKSLEEVFLERTEKLSIFMTENTK